MNTHKKIDFKLMQLVFNGDHAGLNRYAMRKRFTIQEVIDKTAEMEQFFREEREFKENIESFKERSLEGECSINLKDITEDMFYESEHLNEFWRIAYLVHQKQKGETTNG